MKCDLCKKEMKSWDTLCDECMAKELLATDLVDQQYEELRALDEADALAAEKHTDTRIRAGED
jgi:predicted amidophosphoribosyltransferase